MGGGFPPSDWAPTTTKILSNAIYTLLNHAIRKYGHTSCIPSLAGIFKYLRKFELIIPNHSE